MSMALALSSFFVSRFDRELNKYIHLDRHGENWIECGRGGGVVDIIWLYCPVCQHVWYRAFVPSTIDPTGVAVSSPKGMGPCKHQRALIVGVARS